MSCHYFDFDAEALTRNERALALAPNHIGLLERRSLILHTLAQQEEEQGQMIALQHRIDQLLATCDALQAAIPATEVEDLRHVQRQRIHALQRGQRYAEADAVLAQASARDLAEPGVWAERADNQLSWGMAEAHAGRGQEAFIHYQQGLEWIARAVALSDDRSNYLELQAKLQKAVAEGYSPEGTTPPLPSGDPS